MIESCPVPSTSINGCFNDVKPLLGEGLVINKNIHFKSLVGNLGFQLLLLLLLLVTITFYYLLSLATIYLCSMFLKVQPFHPGFPKSGHSSGRRSTETVSGESTGFEIRVYSLQIHEISDQHVLGSGGFRVTLSSQMEIKSWFLCAVIAWCVFFEKRVLSSNFFQSTVKCCR